MKHLISTLVVFAVFAVNALFADMSMRIEYLNDEEQKATISSIARWEIDAANEKFRLVALDGTLLAERNLYADIRRIVFYEQSDSTLVSNNETYHMLSIYPNPTQNLLHIEGAQVGETIRIYSLSGQLLLAQIAGNGQLALSVESLSNGVYLLQVGTEILKFIKQ